MATTGGKLQIAAQITEALAAGSGRVADYSVSLNPQSTISVSNGTAAGVYTATAFSLAMNANKVYSTSGTASATPTDIDLSAVVCLDGTTLSYVRLIIIWNDAATTAYTLTTGGGTNPFKPYLAGTTPTIAINPGLPFIAGQALAANGYTVDSSNKTLRLDPGANNVPYRVLVLGN